MRFHFFLAGVVGVALLTLAPDASAHGGGGGGGGNFHGGGGFHGGGRFHGGGHFHGGFHGRGGHFFHGRFFGPGFGFYGYGYPWWGWDYPYYPYSYYGDEDYDSGSYGDNDPRLNSPRAVQASLAWRGFYSGRIDGVMGPETRSAIRSFQSNQGLPVTGQIDDRLIKALRR